MAATSAHRILSLVPSETESVARLVGLARLVGRTDYCVEPPGIEAVPSVGGTKRCEVERAIALRPDLVLANREENGPRDVEALERAGIPVHVSFPCSLAGSRAYLAELAALLGADASVAVAEHDAVLAAAPEPAWPDRAPRVAVVIWKEPWMSLDERTFASDLLAVAGAANAFDGRARRYPLAADLDRSAPARTTERDTRYPRFALAELIERAPDVVLLPDEPYAFGEDDAAALEATLRPDLPGVRVALTSGKDLFWYGVRAAGAVRRLRAQLAALAP